MSNIVTMYKVDVMKAIAYSSSIPIKAKKNIVFIEIIII